LFADYGLPLVLWYNFLWLSSLGGLYCALKFEVVAWSDVLSSLDMALAALDSRALSSIEELLNDDDSYTSAAENQTLVSISTGNQTLVSTPIEQRRQFAPLSDSRPSGVAAQFCSAAEVPAVREEPAAMREDSSSEKKRIVLPRVRDSVMPRLRELDPEVGRLGATLALSPLLEPLRLLVAGTTIGPLVRLWQKFRA